MDPVPTGAPLAQSDVEDAFREIQEAVASREAEYARANRNRWRFAVAVLVLLLGGALAALLVARGFDRQVFTSNLMVHLQERAPEVMERLKKTAAHLGPVYRAEVQRTLPAFQEALSAAMKTEAGKLGGTLAPLVTQDPVLLTREADVRLAEALQKAFPAQLGRDPAAARRVAAGLRARQLAPWPAGRPGDMGAPFVVIRQIQEAARGMGPPDDENLLRGDMADALWRTAFDVVKTRLAAGDMLAPEKPAEGKAPAPVTQKGGD